MLFPSNFENKIGFDTLRSLIAQQASCERGAEVVMQLSFSADYEQITTSLTLISQVMTLLREGVAFPIPRITDLRAVFGQTNAIGTFLDVENVVDIRSDLQTLAQLVEFVKSLDNERFNKLIGTADGVETFEHILLAIDKILDKYGQIKDSASPELAQIRHQIALAQGSVQRELNRILATARAEGVVDKDVTPTLRQGRLVLPVPAVNKRAIKGIVHDESATGKTVFIEPSSVVEINNRMRELANEERREIIKILIHFTDILRPDYQLIETSMEYVAFMDSLRAKALYSLQIGAIAPLLEKRCDFDWKRARHPLLEANLEKQGKKIVPLNISLSKEKRIMVISGPNAGGKSVCLKTVGLLQYMLQCGLPIPVAEDSTAGLFNSIFIDIGDEQSIENDLSTYSSHLLSMKHCAKYANGKTLLLIDEFGGGTEPQIGGAIAQALLERFNREKAYGIITTHYTNLKHYAANNKGVVNAAMLYDRHKMQPLFMLSIGTAGSSFAIEIANKIGLPKDVIEVAAQLIGSEQVDFDKHLQDVARDKRYWESKREKIHQQEKQLAALTEEYNEKLEQIRKLEKQTLREAKAQAADIINSANAQIENTIRAIKESNADKEVVKKKREALAQTKQSLEDKQVKEKSEVFAVGDYVAIKGQSMAGQIVDIQSSSAVVLFGNIKSIVALEKLEKVSGNQARRMARVGAKAAEVMHEHNINFTQQIDIRGMRAEEAISAVTLYLDDAYMACASSVRILHGTGNGILRQVVRAYLKNCPYKVDYHDEHVQFGGAGITVVEFKKG